MDDEVVSVRVPRKDLEAIDRRVRDGQFMNRSDLVRHAVRSYLEEPRDESGLGPLGALPQAAPQAAASPRRAQRGVKR